MKLKAILFLTLLVICTQSTLATELLSGPIVGHTTSTSAKIWIETDEPAQFTVEYWLEPRIQYQRSLGEPIVRGSVDAQTANNPPHTGVAELKNLKEGWLVYYEIKVDGKVIRPATPQVFSLLPPSTTSPADISVAFASCTYPARVPVQPLWKTVADYRPEAFMLIGDANYMPNNPRAYETSEEIIRYTMSRYHRFLRDVPELRLLLATTPTYGIWDDHDYGPNNSDRTFPWRELSLSIFKQYYPNRSAGLPDTPGLFTSFQIADTEFFLLDDRYHRDPNDDPDRNTMFGLEQINWLKQSIIASKATFKFIVNGNSLLADRRGSGEYWALFGTERDDFIKWLFDNRISGVLFVAGDWHVGTLNRLYRPGDSYPLYELLSSNSAVRSKSPPSGETTDGIFRSHDFAAVEYRGFNFGLITVEGPVGERSVSLEIITEQGDSRIKLVLNEDELKPTEN